MAQSGGCNKLDHLLLSANEETTIYPINQYDSNTSYTTFPVTYLGGAIPRLTSYLRHLTHAASSFVGCMQDVTINNQWIFPLGMFLDILT